MNIDLPNEVLYIINTLEAQGYEACAVGGCVRDSILGGNPKDWDICSSALPEQTMKCFENHRIIETGLRHGTITLVLDGKQFEITTYRIDGGYSDNRRPDNVEFVRNLEQDLSRRDFTINAMAYNPKKGLVDFFNGIDDLKAGVVRCVGNAGKRFQEDALRIMRALRFASVLGFSIEGDTSSAMVENRKLLGKVAVERISAELNKLIVGNNAGEVLTQHILTFAEIIPEIAPTIGFKQNNHHHCHDVLTHILLSVDSAPKDVSVRLTMLLHDIAKPRCYTEENGTGHFYGHPQVSSDMAREILLRLKYDNDTTQTVTQLVLYHDSVVQPDAKNIKRWLNKIGEERFRQLIEVKRADAMAQAVEFRREKTDKLDEILRLTDEIIERRQCFSLKDLAVNGRDLIVAGVPEGVKIGIILNRLTDMVIDEKAENNKSDLLDIVKALNTH